MVGSRIGVTGPQGHVQYGIGVFSFSGCNPVHARKVAMLAGGTGIAPMLQLLHYISRKKAISRLQGRESLHELSLIYCVADEDEFIQRDELLAYKESGLLKLSLVVTSGQGRASAGRRVDLADIASVCGRGSEDAVGLVCGPDGFATAMRDALKQLGHAQVEIF